MPRPSLLDVAAAAALVLPLVAQQPGPPGIRFPPPAAVFPSARVLLRDGSELRGVIRHDLRHGVELAVEDLAGPPRWLPRAAVRWVFRDGLALRSTVDGFGPVAGPAIFQPGLIPEHAHHVALERRGDAPGEILWIAAAPLASPESLDDIVRLLGSCDAVHAVPPLLPARELADLLGAEPTATILPAPPPPTASSDTPPCDAESARAIVARLGATGSTAAPAVDPAALVAAARRALDDGAARVAIVVPFAARSDLQVELRRAAFGTVRFAFVAAEPLRDAGTASRSDDLDARIAALAPAGARVSTWFGPADGPVFHTIDPFATRAAASAIKTAYLVELFATFEDGLDAPLPGADAILAAPDHPALAHFDAAQRAEIQRALTGRSVRDIAGAMIHGRGVSNVVYNAAANLVTATLGGPEELSRRLAARFGDGAAVRRYMLARRDVTGDNEASAAWFARVLRAIATGRIEVRPETVHAMRAVLFDRATDDGRAIWSKTGALDSDPMVRIRTEIVGAVDGTSFVISVVLERDRPETGAADAADRLESACTAITALLRERAR